MQLLEDPLFALVGPKEFPAYHRRHNRGLPLLVILPSLAAFASAVVVIFTRPARLPLWASLVVAVLDLCVIIATVVREAPLHAQLALGRLSSSAHLPTGARQLDSDGALDGECRLVAGVDGAVACRELGTRPSGTWHTSSDKGELRH